MTTATPITTVFGLSNVMNLNIRSNNNERRQAVPP